MQGFKDLVAAVKRCQFLRYVMWEPGGNMVDESLMSALGKWFFHIVSSQGRQEDCGNNHMTMHFSKEKSAALQMSSELFLVAEIHF